MPMSDDNHARLPLLPQQLRDAGYSEVPTYRALREAALDGIFAARRVNGLWYYERARAPEIAASLRLKRTEPAIRSELNRSPSKQSRRTAA